MVPVEVADQAGAVERRRAAEPEVAQPGAEVEQQRILAVGDDGHARRVAAVAGDLVAMARGRPPYAMKPDQHRCSPTPCQRQPCRDHARRRARCVTNASLVTCVARTWEYVESVTATELERPSAPGCCPTASSSSSRRSARRCRMVAPLLGRPAARRHRVHPGRPGRSPPASTPSTTPTSRVSWHHAIETVPTLIRVVDGVEVERTVGWSRAEWQRITGVADLGDDLPVDAPGLRLAQRRPRPRRRAARALRGRPAALPARRAGRAGGRVRGDLRPRLDRRPARRPADRGARAADARGHRRATPRTSSPPCRRTSSTSPSRRSPSPP